MNTQLQKQLWFLSLLLLFQLTALAQGLPPGWDYLPTPTTHIVSIPLECNPNINDFPINPGDWFGVFYLDDEGELACGGAVEWPGDVNTGIIAFGNDSFTPEKDGFSSGETLNWKVYSWSVQKEYPAVVTCNDGLPSPCDVFTANGLSGLATFDASGFYISAVAEPDTLCQGNESQLNANASGGSGSYTYSWISDPPGFTSDIANPLVNPSQNTIYTVQVTDLGETLSNSVSVYVFPPPEVSAGNDITICEDEMASLNGDVSNYQSFLWTSNGDGVFSDPAILDPDYTPGINDISNGGVTLTLTAQPIEPCFLPVSANMQLAISGLPQLDAGVGQTICEDNVVQLAASASNFSSLFWTSSGDGFFNDPSLPDAIYTPGFGDLVNGNVVLEIEANPVSPCTGIVNDIVSVDIILLPEINAGSNIAICENGIAELSGEAVNFQSILWISNGDGSFDDPSLLNATYTPGTDDLQTGGATLSLVAQPVAPCVEVIIDNLDLSIIMLPAANAGIDATVCEDDSHQLNASATHFEEVIWSSSGDGVFADPNALSTSYTPGSDDIMLGEVTLILKALPEFPCSLNAEDELILSIMNLPDLNAGDDSSVCEEESLQLDATAVNFNSFEWSTSGDGIFDDPLLLNATYIPGADDILAGNVDLTLTATPLFPCVNSVSDQLSLSIISLPEPIAGDDATICADETHQLDGQASNYLLIQWITSGDGSFSNAIVLNPVYTPGSGDIQNGSVEISLTAIPLTPCTEMQQSDLSLTITPLPQADAGPDATVQSGDVHQMDGVAEDYSALLWTTSGDGNFSDTGILDPFYTPGEQDIALTQVTLTLTANPLSPCVSLTMDDMILEIDTITGLSQIVKRLSLKVFPNPTNGHLQISIPSQAAKKSCSLKLFTLGGDLLLDEIHYNNAPADEFFIPIDLSFYPDGIFLVQLATNKRIWQSKVILKKE